MLFNSLEFVLVFLPIALVGFIVVERFSYVRALHWLILCSLAFYAYWNPPFVLLLIASLVANYGFARQILSDRLPARKKIWLGLAVGFNLGLLGYFKYRNFFLENVSLLSGFSIDPSHLFLPLGISFFTFQQIAFLMDTHQGKVANLDLSKYVLFICFFPQLIAGPIVHHSEIIPQMKPSTRELIFDRVGLGMSIFIWGLVKKVCVADPLGLMADGIIDSDQFHDDAVVAWQGVLAFSFQLYFDFSAYSDMAIGLGVLFGFRLPINFNSPYQARNIQDFWRRWHITLSKFLRDYLYIPLGGNRGGNFRLYRNLFLTMLIGGLWHGAGWTFIVWGAYHGVLLCVYHGVLSRQSRGAGLINEVASRALTFLLVVIGWAIFRAKDLNQARDLLQSMFLGHIDISSIDTFAWMIIAAAAIVCMYLPNASYWLNSFGRFSAYPRSEEDGIRLKPNPIVGVAFALLAVVAIISMQTSSEFLYFQF